ncbi:XIAP-associated factor 1 [Trifolium pratense]|uniref:XIAP-associated factor 1 n=1 Tax=Trifolium pratense TaxID=57577 RepID=A0A2K3PEV0_TRIPR|nr:XIAP-associated factor 1 [Trifolium pratense]
MIAGILFYLDFDPCCVVANDDLEIVHDNGKDHTPDYTSGSHLKWLGINDSNHSAFTVPRRMILVTKETYPRIETYNGSPASMHTVHTVTIIQYVGETIDRDIIDIHKGENCPKRIVTCDFCEFPLPAVDLAEHQEVCGNRTELCHLCNKYVRLRERYTHEARCNGIQDSAVGSSRNVREAERDEGVQRRRPQNEFSTKRLLFSIAITGIAVILGSIFLQRKADPSEMH